MLAWLTFLEGWHHNPRMQSLYIEFGRLLREMRIGKKLTQLEVAEKVGLSRTSITNIELGRQQMPLHMLYLIANAVGVDPQILLPDKKFASGEAGLLTTKIESLELDDASKRWIQSIALGKQKGRGRK